MLWLEMDPRPTVQLLFFCDWLLACLVILVAGFMLGSSYLLRFMRRKR